MLELPYGCQSEERCNILCCSASDRSVKVWDTNAVHCHCIVHLNNGVKIRRSVKAWSYRTLFFVSHSDENTIYIYFCVEHYELADPDIDRTIICSRKCITIKGDGKVLLKWYEPAHSITYKKHVRGRAVFADRQIHY